MTPPGKGRNIGQGNKGKCTVVLSEVEINIFQQKVLDYYRWKGRHDLPWRMTDNPYHILVSEIMLQQTQVSRCLVKYPEFISEFPDFLSLADAPLAEILRVWKGIGYNRRAIALKTIAGLVVTRHNPGLPENPLELMTFPGIGKATAASIAAFAYNKPVVFIETNIRRVFLHCFFRDRVSVPDREILPLVALALDRENPRQWYYALMDLGSSLAKSVQNPNRRSAHYRRQSPFEGSGRQVRGRVLAMLLEKGVISLEDLVKSLGTGPDHAGPIIREMEREGFLVLENGIVRLR